MHTIEGVEICTAGMDWHASTGVHAITLENIADAVVAANEDPHIQVPRGKLGHYSDVNAGLPMWDPFAAVGDAAPAFGRFINLRTANDGAVLIGDAIDVPDWINASSYPSRSMESVPDVTTEGGKHYSMVVTAVAWLGEPLPAVSDIEDLVALLADGPSALTQPKEVSVPAPTPTAASVSTSVIRDRFNCEWAAENDHWWWWARDLRVDPPEIIADDDEGGLWSVPYETDGKDDVTFGEPVRVRETFTPVGTAAAAERVAAAVRTVATFSRPVKNNPPAAASADEPTTKEDHMPEHVNAFLVAQGIDPDEATEDQIAAATLLAPDPTAETPEDVPEPEPVEEPAEPEDEPEAEIETDTVPVSREVWEQTLAEVSDLKQKDADRELIAATKRKDAYADQWVKDGRITPAEHALARQNLDINEEATVKAYTAMAKGRVPVVPSPGGAAASATSDEEALLAASRARMGHTAPKEA